MKPEQLTKKKALRQYWKIMRRVAGRKKAGAETEEETVLLDSLEATIRAFDNTTSTTKT